MHWNFASSVIVNVLFVILLSSVIAVIDQLRVEILVDVTDCPVKAEKGDDVTMYYNGTFENETSFDANLSITLTIGPGLLIEGFNLGLYNACIGQTRKIFVPYMLGYGVNGTTDGKIPGKADIIFVVEVFNITKNPSEEQTSTELAEDGNMTSTEVMYIDDEDDDNDIDDGHQNETDSDNAPVRMSHRKPFWWYLQFLAIPVLIILLVVDAYYLYKLYFPHGRVKFYKVRDHEPTNIMSNL